MFHCSGISEWNGTAQYDGHVASFQDEVEEVDTVYFVIFVQSFLIY